MRLIEPLGYLPFVQLMARSTLILTDSGGVQEEAPALGKPVLVMRDRTERTEGVDEGMARVVGLDPKRIVAEASGFLSGRECYESAVGTSNLYGDGFAATRIVAACREYLRTTRDGCCESPIGGECR